MLKEVILSEETVELAIEKACKTLGQNKSNINFEVIQQPSTGLFGVFGGKMAQIKATIKETPAEKAVKFLKKILPDMGLASLSVDILNEENEYCEIKMDGGVDVSFVLGKHGEVLDSLQYLCGLIANDSCHEDSRFCRVRLEAGEYRENRRRTLMALGKNIAEQVYRHGKPISLEPMKSYDRMVIHMAVDKIKGVRSWSEGNERVRYVVIAPDFMNQKNAGFMTSAENSEDSFDSSYSEDFDNRSYRENNYNNYSGSMRKPDYTDSRGYSYNTRKDMNRYDLYNNNNIYGPGSSSYSHSQVQAHSHSQAQTHSPSQLYTRVNYRERPDTYSNYRKPEFSTSDTNYSEYENYNNYSKYDKYNKYFQMDENYFENYTEENNTSTDNNINYNFSETQDITSTDYKN